MSRVFNHFRSNVVAYVALFAALGGTSYAAVDLPAGSVGNQAVEEPLDHLRTSSIRAR